MVLIAFTRFGESIERTRHCDGSILEHSRLSSNLLSIVMITKVKQMPGGGGRHLDGLIIVGIVGLVKNNEAGWDPGIHTYIRDSNKEGRRDFRPAVITSYRPSGYSEAGNHMLMRPDRLIYL